MIPTLDSCTKYGERAALLALIPGLGHFRSRQYLVGTADSRHDRRSPLVGLLVGYSAVRL